MKIASSAEIELYRISDIATELIVTDKRMYFHSSEIQNATVDVNCVSHLYFAVAAKKLSALVVVGLILAVIAAAAFFLSSSLPEAITSFEYFSQATIGLGALGGLLFVVGLVKMQKRKGTLTIGVDGAEIKLPFEKIKEDTLTKLRNAIFDAKDHMNFRQ